MAKTDNTDTPDTSAVVAGLIEETIAPYRGIVSDEQLAYFEVLLDTWLTTNPKAVSAVRRLQALPRRVTSGVVDRSGAEETKDEETAKAGKGQE